MAAAGRQNQQGAALLLAGTLSCTLCEASEPPAAFDVETARRLVAELGPRKAAEQVASDSLKLEAVASGVASTRQEWLDVGVRLIGTTDAYLKDRLLQAFSYALQQDATRVLQGGAAGVPLDAVCGYDPFTGVDSPPTRSQFYQALVRRERAVSGVTRADLAAEKSACLAALRLLQTEGAKRYKP